MVSGVKQFEPASEVFQTNAAAGAFSFGYGVGH